MTTGHAPYGTPPGRPYLLVTIKLAHLYTIRPGHFFHHLYTCTSLDVTIISISNSFFWVDSHNDRFAIKESTECDVCQLVVVNLPVSFSSNR